MWLSSKEIRTKLKISSQILYNWSNQNKIKTKKELNKTFYWFEEDFEIANLEEDKKIDIKQVLDKLIQSQEQSLQELIDLKNKI